MQKYFVIRPGVGLTLFLTMLGQKLKKLRDLKGLSLRELEELSGVSNVMISRYEAGKAQPSTKPLKKLAIALDTSFEDLLEELRGGTSVSGFNNDEFNVKLKKALLLKPKEKEALSVIMDSFLKNLEFEKLAGK